MNGRLGRLLFDPIDARPLGLFRIFLGTVLAARLATLCAQFQPLFALDGPLAGFASWQPLPFTGMGWAPLFHWQLFSLSRTDGWAIFLLAVYGASLVALTLGWKTRLATIAAFVLTLSLHRRVPIIWCGGDVVLQIFLFWMIFTPAGACLSFDAARGSEPSPRVSAWVLLLLKAQLSLVYASAFLAKLGTPAWLDGSAVAYAWEMHPYVRPWGGALATADGLVAAVSYGTLAFELSFPLLLWFRRFTPWLLAAGVALQLGMEATLRLFIFPWAMLAPYVLFLDPERQPARLLSDLTRRGLEWIAGSLLRPGR